AFPPREARFSLSQRERVRVRGNGAKFHPAYWTNHGTFELSESFGKARGVPRRHYDRPFHTLAFRVLRATHPHAVSVSLRHREHDGRAASVREGDGGGGWKIFLRSQLRRLAAKMVHEKSGDHIRAGPARNAPSHQPRGEARGAN